MYHLKDKKEINDSNNQINLVGNMFLLEKFEALVKSSKYVLSEKNAVETKCAVVNYLEKNSSIFINYKKKSDFFVIFNIFKIGDLYSFCSSCGQMVEDRSNVIDYLDCPCQRIFHKKCLDHRYTKQRLYNYDTFQCFFCRKVFQEKKRKLN